MKFAANLNLKEHQFFFTHPVYTSLAMEARQTRLGVWGFTTTKLKVKKALCHYALGIAYHVSYYRIWMLYRDIGHQYLITLLHILVL